jgi:hypothetical protein
MRLNIGRPNYDIGLNPVGRLKAADLAVARGRMNGTGDLPRNRLRLLRLVIRNSRRHPY